MSIRHPGAARSLLHRAATPGPDGLIASIDPSSAGWEFLSFSAYRLAPGQVIEGAADDQERLILVLEGSARIRVGDDDLGVVGTRATVFDGPPPPVLLLEPGRAATITAVAPSLLAVGAAPGGGLRRTALIAPEEILVEQRGSGQTARKIHHLLPPNAEAGRLIAFEVFTPGGNWSS